MKIHGATRVWLIASSAAAICIFTTGALRASGALGQGALIGAFTISIAILCFFAIKLAMTRPRLNLTLAAETIVALGIFSLIISITVVLLNVSEFLVEISQRDLTIADIRQFAWPFAEGLAAAAIAPFVATLLRHTESNFASFDSGDAGMADAAREAAALANELKLAVVNFRAVNAEIVTTKDAFEKAMSNAVRGTNTLASTLQTEAERLRVALQRVQAEATGLADASERSRVIVTELGTGFRELKSSSKDASGLLDALGKLIESVERYIRPDRAMS